jgi:CheY-like chemotaxis protein
VQGVTAPRVGLELALADPPDLLLLDIQMPDMDGYELLRRLRAAAQTRALPVIAVSANAMPQDLERGIAAGFADYLTKPLDLAQLLEAVSRALPAPPFIPPSLSPSSLSQRRPRP